MTKVQIKEDFNKKFSNRVLFVVNKRGGLLDLATKNGEIVLRDVRKEYVYDI